MSDIDFKNSKISYSKSVEKGFNTDLSLDGFSYHIQTEDWGYLRPYIVTQVFRNGAILKTQKVHYSEIMSVNLLWNSTEGRSVVTNHMEKQHEQTLDQLRMRKLI